MIFLLPLATRFVPPALSLHIRLPRPICTSSRTFVTLLPRFPLASFLPCKLLCTLHARTQTHAAARRRSPSFPTLLPPYSPVLKCPLPASALVINLTPLLCLCLDFIQTHWPILFQDTPLPPARRPTRYLFPPVPDWIVTIPPKWISVLTIQRLE